MRPKKPFIGKWLIISKFKSGSHAYMYMLAECTYIVTSEPWLVLQKECLVPVTKAGVEDIQNT